MQGISLAALIIKSDNDNGHTNIQTHVDGSLHKYSDVYAAVWFKYNLKINIKRNIKINSL